MNIDNVLPKTLLAAAHTEHLELSVVVIPAFEKEIVCCSILHGLQHNLILSFCRINRYRILHHRVKTISFPSIMKLRVLGFRITEALRPATEQPLPDV